MWAANIVELTLTRRAREQQPTKGQKFLMCIIGVVVLGSFAMLCLQEAGIVESNSLIFSYLLLSLVSAISGYLFGSNMKTQMFGGGS